MGFTFLDRRDYGKAAVLAALMCALAHVRRTEMQKRWLGTAKQQQTTSTRFVDHPAVAYLLENLSLFGTAYLLCRFLPKPVQARPFYSFLLGYVATVLSVEPLLVVEKFMAVYLYPHVPYFSTRGVAKGDLWTLVKDYATCNMPAGLINNVMLTTLVCTMSEDKFNDRILNPPPLRLMPYLAKYAFCRIVVDLVFGVAHRAMHEYPSIYNTIHKRHHEHQNPRTGTNFHFHFVDVFLEAIFPFQVAFVSLVALGYAPTHTEQVCLLIPTIYYESASHTGKEIPTVTWFPLLSPLVNYFTGCDQRLIEYHTRHHQLYRCNYSISPWVDKLWGTYRIDLPEHYNSAEAEQVQN